MEADSVETTDAFCYGLWTRDWSVICPFILDSGSRSHGNENDQEIQRLGVRG